jgi:glycine/D-amino acid oxidase-like deaminating enzyme/nitrite reductase/ring-hydroxylating ferredoxin subunit
MDADVDRASLWMRRAEAREARPTTPPDLGALTDRYDAVVVGAGLAGLCTALRLTDDSLRVLVLEAGRVGARTTGHSTAKITALQGTTYSSLRRGKGREAAEIYAWTAQTAVERFRDLVRTLDIDCAFTDAPAYTVAATADGAREIESEAEAARAAGLPVELTTTTDLPFPVTAAVRLDAQAHFDPFAFCNGLAGHLHERGATIVEGARVTDVGERADGCTVSIGEAEVRATFVVLTTHLPVVDPALLAGRSHPERSYAVAGPAPHSVTGMHLAVDEGWSIRPAPIPEEPDWLVVGGEGHSMQDHVSSADHYARLERWARERLGVDVQERWSAFDYAPTDGVPYIGRLASGSRRRFVATGFRKWGMTTSMVAADLLADHIAGRSHRAHALFDATRIMPTLGRDALTANARVAAHFLGARLRAPSDSRLERLQPGEGTVVRIRLHTVAAARDRDGTLHTLRASCTHLGCPVQFNDGEQTWDCPCHGSRFAIDGSVLDGPADRPLRPH